MAPGLLGHLRPVAQHDLSRRRGGGREEGGRRGQVRFDVAVNGPQGPRGHGPDAVGPVVDHSAGATQRSRRSSQGADGTGWAARRGRRRHPRRSAAPPADSPETSWLDELASSRTAAAAHRSATVHHQRNRRPRHGDAQASGAPPPAGPAAVPASAGRRRRRHPALASAATGGRKRATVPALPQSTRTSWPSRAVPPCRSPASRARPARAPRRRSRPGRAGPAAMRRVSRARRGRAAGWCPRPEPPGRGCGSCPTSIRGPTPRRRPGTRRSGRATPRPRPPRAPSLKPVRPAPSTVRGPARPGACGTPERTAPAFPSTMPGSAMRERERAWILRWRGNVWKRCWPTSMRRSRR